MLLLYVVRLTETEFPYLKTFPTDKTLPFQVTLKLLLIKSKTREVLF